MSQLEVRRHNEAVLEELEVGDLIEFNRGLYSHWAVYVGEGQVVHLAGDANDGLNANVNSGSLFTICGQRFNKAFVKMDEFWNVVLDSKAYKNNKKDKEMNDRFVDKLRQAVQTQIELLLREKFGQGNWVYTDCHFTHTYTKYQQGTKPKSSREIVDNAFSMIGEIGYNVLWKNCEHFASLCRYGVEKSDQATNFLGWTAAGFAAGVAVVAMSRRQKSRKN